MQSLIPMKNNDKNNWTEEIQTDGQEQVCKKIKDQVLV